MSSNARLDKDRAKELLIQIEKLVTSASKENALRDVVKLLNGVPSYSWVGVYQLEGNDLVLRAWAGPQATVHTRIPIGKGVCGWAARSGRTEIVSDVSKDSRYVECFTNTKSEIVVPVLLGRKLVGEIDIDGNLLNAYSLIDKQFLEAVAEKISLFLVGE
jgi:L-methionine (R)-S-oxide reductase